MFGSMTGDGELDSLGSENSDLNLDDGGMDSDLEGEKGEGLDTTGGLLGDEGLLSGGGRNGGGGSRGRRPAAAVSHLDYEDNDF